MVHPPAFRTSVTTVDRGLIVGQMRPDRRDRQKRDSCVGPFAQDEEALYQQRQRGQRFCRAVNRQELSWVAQCRYAAHHFAGAVGYP